MLDERVGAAKQKLNQKYKFVDDHAQILNDLTKMINKFTDDIEDILEDNLAE